MAAQVVLPSPKMTQFDEWSFDKAVNRSQRAASASSSSPGSDSDNDNEKIRLDTAVANAMEQKNEPLLQDGYLSSEEDLSPMEMSGNEDDISIVEAGDYLTAKAVSPPLAATPLTIDCGVRATVVSYIRVNAGAAKVVDAATSPTEAKRPARISSLPSTQKQKARRSGSPLARESVFNDIVQDLTEDNISRTSSKEESSPEDGTNSSDVDAAKQSDASSRKTSQHSSKGSMGSIKSFSAGSSTPPSSISSEIERPKTAKPTVKPALPLLSTRRLSSASYRHSTISPEITRPGTPSFLRIDPFAQKSTSPKAEEQKSREPHKRLRSISKTLALAKIAVTGEGRRFSETPLTPKTPTTPRTPMSPATPKGQQPKRKMTARGAQEREPIMELPTPPEEKAQAQIIRPKSMMRQKLIPRGADEREPTLELPPFPSDGESERSVAPPMPERKRPTMKKRKSLLGLGDFY